MFTEYLRHLWILEQESVEWGVQEMLLWARTCSLLSQTLLIFPLTSGANICITMTSIWLHEKGAKSLDSLCWFQITGVKGAPESPGAHGGRRAEFLRRWTMCVSLDCHLGVGPLEFRNLIALILRASQHTQ